VEGTCFRSLRPRRVDLGGLGSGGESLSARRGWTVLTREGGTGKIQRRRKKSWREGGGGRAGGGGRGGGGGVGV